MFTIFPILTGFLVVIIILTVIIKLSDKKQQDEIEDFFSREKNAKMTPAVDLDTLSYLNVPYDKFFFGSINDPEVKKMEDEIIAISKRPLLNLTGKTNTELREIYGAPNLEAMKAIGEDFDKLTIVLVSYGEALINHNLISEAITVLEYGVYIKSDVSKTYTLLGDCFAKLGQTRRIHTLKEQVTPLHLLMEPVIMKHLDELINAKDPDSESAPTQEATSE